ncbi:two-component system, LytTR family, response regulator AgrA [Enterococcus sp. AZ194]|uniref:LytR/AlgR family response regulator transcription factor n=1 Tax=Enterococcus sp. AZ194 TaxID=2774629 RepID=UPI003F2563B8
MNIFILEDDLMQQQRLEQLIKEILSEYKWFPRLISTTAQPQRLLKKAEKAQGKSIYFLDIEIKNEKKNGLEVAQDIRKFDPYGMIVFVTTHFEFAPHTYKYKVSALDFINKENDEIVIKSQVTECMALLFNPGNQLVSDEAFIFENKHSHFQIPFSNILYFETSSISHKIRLIGKTKIIEFYATLDEIEQLDSRFFKCHRSFVINLSNVESINRSENIVAFENNHTCLISRRKVKKAIYLIDGS